jgi:K+-sensing histidine kinase KdpD
MLKDSLVGRYILASVFAGNGAAAHLIIASQPDDHPFLTFYISIILAATICGFGPALAASVFSTLIVWFFFIPPIFSFAVMRASDFGTLLLFLGSGLLIVAAIRFLSRAQ